jgi:hypothetical protein
MAHGKQRLYIQGQRESKSQSRESVSMQKCRNHSRGQECTQEQYRAVCTIVPFLIRLSNN